MKNRIIAIVVTVVFIAGAGTAVGVIVDKQHDKETVSMIDEAVSMALATTETTTKESTTETTTTEPAATTEKTTEQTTEQTTTVKPIEETTTTTEVQTVMRKGTQTAEVKTTSPTKQQYVYHLENYKKAIIDEKEVMVYIVVGNGPDNGKYCYLDENNKSIYIDDISKIEFID